MRGLILSKNYEFPQNRLQGGDLWRVESLRAAPLGGDGGGDAARRRRGRRDGARGGRRRAARTGAQFNRHFGDVPKHVSNHVW